MSRAAVPIALTALALVAFAGNSLLCRAALAPGVDGPSIDPVSFAAIRFGAGALVLAPVLLGPAPKSTREDRSRPWLPGAALLVYALAFSASYTTLPTGAGALILFGTVQLTMLAAARLEGDRLGARRAFGALLAFGGLVLLLAPSPETLIGVDPLGALLMAIAGVGWGAYTLLGRGAAYPVRANARNFLVALPGLLLALPFADLVARPAGVALAIGSGAICSGLGYAVWYRALRAHSAVSAALCQLTVPVLAALFGLAFLEEPLTLVWSVASTLVLAGVLLGLRAPRSRSG